MTHDGRSSLTTDDRVWRAIRSDPGAGVTLIDADGAFLFANPRAMELYTGDEWASWEGRSVRDFYEAGPTDEMMKMIGAAIESERAVVYRHKRNGIQLQSAYWPLLGGALNGQGDHVSAVLGVTREGKTIVPRNNGFDVVESEYADLGPLSALTRRELEVLALLGQGLSLEQIAQTLHRAKKTIDKHRVSIGKKLDANNRVQLAKIADAAALELRDAELIRTSPPATLEPV